MKISIKRSENKDCWLWGHILINNVVFCDSLEMGNDNQINAGTYDINISYTKDHSEQYISIWYNENQFISVFTTHNNFMYYNIEMRRDNNFVTIGTRSGLCWLVNQAGKNFQLRNMIEKVIEKGEKVVLIVENEIKSTKSV